ncbi:hypothetical protein [Nonomuraea basaltis]|nr:hypothetical protein [Nonomuraea basaltis]
MEGRGASLNRPPSVEAHSGRNAVLTHPALREPADRMLKNYGG